MSSVCPFPSCGIPSVSHTFSCSDHFSWSLIHHKETQNQFSMTGKTDHQLNFTRDRAQLIHKVLEAFQSDGQRITRYLKTLLRRTEQSNHRSFVLYGTPLPEGEEARAWDRMIDAFIAVISTLSWVTAGRDDWGVLEDDPFHETPGLQVFAKAVLNYKYDLPDNQDKLKQWGLFQDDLAQLSSLLRLCARTVLRVPRDTGRFFWINLSKQANALQLASVAYAQEREKVQTARFMATLAHQGLAFAPAFAPVPALAPAAVPEGPLAAFAHDAQNVHTAPAQTQASAAIRVLMDPAVPEWEACFEAFGTIYSGNLSGKRMRAFRESLETDEVQEVAVHLDYTEPFLTTIHYAEMFCAAWALIESAALDLQAPQLDDLAGVANSGYCTTDMFRLEDMADFLCKWTPSLAPQIGTGGLTNLELWMKHRFNPLLSDIRGSMMDMTLLATVEEDWSKVMLQDMWSEFSHDAYNTYDFGTLYGDLLQRLWNYASTQAIPVKKEIVIRLAQEVLDGRGMCPQGKMTRLANVLRGFHTGLESVSALSVKEQLQNRMAVVGTLPLAERRAAAEAVFTELGIVEDRDVWLEAVLEA